MKTFKPRPSRGWFWLALLAVIFERMRRATRGLKDDQSGNEVVYWQRHIPE